MSEEIKANVRRKKQARFSTDALIHHSQTEFRITFFDTFMYNDKQQNKDIVGEIVVTPKHAKALLTALEDNIKKYEKQFGAIKIPKKPPKTKVMGVTQEEPYR